MKTRLRNLWEKLATSFWPVPGGLTAAAAALAFLTVALDRTLETKSFEGITWLAQASPEGARSLLSTVASAMLTTAGVVFSVTIVALTMASGQFGPRLLRNFISARSTQIVLGSLLGTFLYCLLVLRTVHAKDEASFAFLPHLSLLTAIFLTVLTLALFIYFIHAIAISLQADRVIAKVNGELVENIDRLCSLDSNTGNNPGLEPFELDETAPTLEALRDGYLQAIATDTLLEISQRLDLRLQLLCRPGDFLHENGAVARCEGGPPEENNTEALRHCFLIGADRTPEQDFAFSIRQLVEIGLRALSPGINDPFTAITCIDYLGAALGKIADGCLPPSALADSDGIVRLSLRPSSFRDFLGVAFDQLRDHSSGHHAVTIRLLESLGRIAEQLPASADLEAIYEQAELVATIGRESARSDNERDLVDATLQRIRDALSA